MNGKKEYRLADAVMFAHVMQDEQLCRMLIERIFLGRRVEKVFFPERNVPAADAETAAVKDASAEVSIEANVFARGIRLDVLFEGESVMYDIEMQVRQDADLPMRSRYYHSVIDSHVLRRGEEYGKLKPCYVIFICAFDPCGLDEPIYSISSGDRKLSLPWKDKAFTILLNTACSERKIPDELKAFYHYVRFGTEAEYDPFIAELDRRVKEANESGKVANIMTLEEDYRVGLKEARAAGRNEGLDEGRRSGLDEGRRSGLAEGRRSGLAEGRETGLAEGKHDDAGKMKAMGMPAETIAQITGLSMAEIEKL